MISEGVVNRLLLTIFSEFLVSLWIKLFLPFSNVKEIMI